MCLISVSPKGTSKDIRILSKFIESGMQSNTDGSGFSYKRNGTDLVNLSKGFRDSKVLCDAIEACKLEDDDELIIHHRIGTSGLRDNINMHPFVVSEDESILRSVDGSFNLPIMAHNGVFHNYSDHHSPYSDTYHFIHQFMAVPELVSLLKKSPEFFKNTFTNVINLTSNKLAFLFPDRDMVLLGNWTEEDGYKHSNGGYKRFVYDKGGSSNRSSNHAPSKYYGFGWPHSEYDDEDLRYDTEDNYPVRTQGQSEFYRTHTWDIHSSRWVKDPIILGEGKDLISEAITISMNSQIKTSGIKFTTKDIRITNANAHHFIFVTLEEYKTLDGNTLEKNKAFSLEKYDSNAVANYIVSFDATKVMYYVKADEMMEICSIYVKKDYASGYEGLYKLSKKCANGINKTLLGKISKALAVKSIGKTFNFKEYGKLEWSDLNYFYSKHNPKKANMEVVKDDEPIVAVEDFMS